MRCISVILLLLPFAASFHITATSARRSRPIDKQGRDTTTDKKKKKREAGRSSLATQGRLVRDEWCGL